MDERSTLKVIRPDDRMAEGSIKAVHHITQEIWHFRSHIWIVFREQFRHAYYGAGLGVLWNYVLPVVPLSVYLLLSRLRLLPNFESVDSAVYLTFGVTLWLLFSGCIQTPIQVVQSRNSESMKTAFPLSAAIISGYAKLLFETMIRVTFVLATIITTKSWPTVEAMLLPLALLPALLLFSGIGMILSILNVIYTDVSRVVSICLQYGIFISGAIFPLQGTGLLHEINQLNPLAIFMEAARSIVFLGSIDNQELFFPSSFAAILVFAFSCKIFYIMEYRVRGIG